MRTSPDQIPPIALWAVLTFIVVRQLALPIAGAALTIFVTRRVLRRRPMRRRP